MVLNIAIGTIGIVIGIAIGVPMTLWLQRFADNLEADETAELIRNSKYDKR